MDELRNLGRTGEDYAAHARVTNEPRPNGLAASGQEL